MVIPADYVIGGPSSCTMFLGIYHLDFPFPYHVIEKVDWCELLKSKFSVNC